MTDTRKATFGAGCFWGVEVAFRQVPGVLNAEAGYEGGTLRNPSYEDARTGRTGHAEVVEVTYDPARVSYGRLPQDVWRWAPRVRIRRMNGVPEAAWRSA